MFRILTLARERVLSTGFQHAQSAHTAQRWYSAPGRRPGFFSQVVKNFRDEISKDKEMKENMKKFLEHKKALEETDALKAARRKFDEVESNVQRSSTSIRSHLDAVKEKVGDVLDEAVKTDLAKKMGDELSKTTKIVSETLSDTGEKLGKTSAFKAISNTSEMLQNELQSNNLESKVYKPLKKLRKRIEVNVDAQARVFAANEEATGVELHKDSKFYASWENFKNNNAYVNKVLDWKTKYDESESPLARASRAVTDRVSEVIGGMFTSTTVSESMTEIVRLDPSFSEKKFLHDCSTDILPNIMGAYIQRDYEILKDWCHQPAFAHVKHWIEEDKALYTDVQMLDIENLDIIGGQVVDQGPVLFLRFETQEVKRAHNNDEKLFKVTYTFVLCRDPEELNPKAAWRLLEAARFAQPQLV